MTDETTVDPETFAAANGITMTFEQVADRPDPTSWADGCHWRVTLNREGLEFSIFYSQHKSNEKDPQLYDVMGCLASDASTSEASDTFDEWCDNFGYDTDSRQAERIYNQCRKQSADLKTFLGGDLYTELLTLEY